MVQVIGVRFQNGGKIYFFGADQFDVRCGDYVIVETVKGIEIAEVTMSKTEMDEERLVAPVKQIIRKATEQDIRHSAELRVHEKEAFGICQKKIAEHKLEMKLVGVESSFDNSKITFFFTANGRVDFRSLVKDLASVFKTRIELRQIGVRDEARMIGGLGPCGRQICCGSFLEDFEPVSIKMAKEQNLSLNPTKISGVCGRLMCCLKYEEDAYEETRKRMPKIGREVITPDGTGVVNDLNIVKETVKVRIAKGDSYEINEYALDQIQRPENANHSSEDANQEQEHTESEGDVNTNVLTSEEQTDTVSDENQEKQAIEEVNDTELLRGPQESRAETDKAVGPVQTERPNRRNYQKNHPLGQPVRREKKESRADAEHVQDQRRAKPEVMSTTNRRNDSAENTATNKREEGKQRYQGRFGPRGKRSDRDQERHFRSEPAQTAKTEPQHRVTAVQPPKPVEKKNNWQADLERALKAAGDSKD